MTNGNLSSHLMRLAAAALGEISTSFSGRPARTSVTLTPLGRACTAEHREPLERLKDAAAERPAAG